MSIKVEFTPPSKVDHTKIDRELDAKARAYKREVSRKASMANKRLKRLEKNNLTNLPAYKNWLDYKGGVKFSVKGKSHNELVAEMARLDRFINAKTSTVRGANKTLKQIASSNNISYKKVGELNAKLSNFFSLYNKVNEYLDNSMALANAVGSDSIMEIVQNYVKDQKVNLDGGLQDVDSMIEDITKAVSLEYGKQATDDLLDNFDTLF